MLIPFSEIVKKYRISGGHILHIGAHKCEERLDYRKYGWDDSKVLWIEGNPEIYTEVKKANPTLNLQYGLVTDKDGDVAELIVTNNTKSSSIMELDQHKAFYPWVFETKRIKLPTSTVSTILKKTGIDRSDIMFANIHIQGAEMLALKGMEEYLPEIKYLYIEVRNMPLYKGSPDVDEMDSYLYRFGFVRADTMMSDHGWGDALYINENPKVTCVLRGGLGNRLFILAAMMGYTFKNPVYKGVITHTNNEPFYQPNQRVNPSYFLRGLAMEQTIPVQRVFIEHSGYDSKFQDIDHGIKASGNLLLDGYFQDEKYFEGIEQWVYSQFRCPFDIQILLQKTYPSLDRGAFIHIRRTDTLHLPYPDVTSYYNDCIRKYPSDTVFFICSDDLNWCKSNILVDNRVFVEEDAIPTLWLMSLCGRGGIVGISTFSWWGGWLNKMRSNTGTIYCPQTRFNPSSKLFETVSV